MNAPLSHLFDGVCGPQVALNALGKLSAPQIAYVVVLVLAAGLVVGAMLEGRIAARQLLGLLAGAAVIGVLVFAL